MSFLLGAYRHAAIPDRRRSDQDRLGTKGLRARGKEGAVVMSEHEPALAALEQQRRLHYEQARQFINGLHATWECPDDPSQAGIAEESVLGAWIAGQAGDLDALRERVRALQETLLALREKQ